MLPKAKELVFEDTECRDLLSVVGLYLNFLQDNATDYAAFNRLVEIRKSCGDLAMMCIIRELTRRNFADIPDEKVNEVAFASVAGTNFKTEGRLLAVGEDAREVVIDNSDGVLTQAINWAAVNFVEGSVVLQNIRGRILNSNYEDSPISKQLGQTNARFANQVAEQTLHAGESARQWVQQLA